jgi:glycine/D-amino acid oxidase-like deaminating enzyme
LTVQTVVIVGGGAAGWLSAGIIAASRQSKQNDALGARVVLLESPDVATLGVGEGTWPTMRDTLRKIGISESEFIRSCDVSFKQGSQFIGWRRGEGESYYHPFSAPQAYGSVNLAEHWLNARSNAVSPTNSDDLGGLNQKRNIFSELSFTDAVTAQGYICDKHLAPKTAQSPEYAFNLNYGYHLNAGKFTSLLQNHCLEKLSVEHRLGHVEDIISAENGDIEKLKLAGGELVEGDLFIDCTGFSAKLIGEHFKVPYISQKEFLFNDTALAVQVDHASDDVPIASCTKSTAQAHGWIWDIPLSRRRGIGHVSRQ